MSVVITIGIGSFFTHSLIRKSSTQPLSKPSLFIEVRRFKTPSMYTPKPLQCASGKVAEGSVCHGQQKDVIKRWEEGDGRVEGRRELGGRRREAASSVSSEIGVAGSLEPFSFAETESWRSSRDRKKKRKERKTSMTKRNVADMLAARH